MSVKEFAIQWRPGLEDEEWHILMPPFGSKAEALKALAERRRSEYSRYSDYRIVRRKVEPWVVLHY